MCWADSLDSASLELQGEIVVLQDLHGGIPGLVNVYILLWKITIFDGKITIFDGKITIFYGKIHYFNGHFP